MGLSWQQGPLSPGAIGRFLVPEPLPERLLYVEPLRRRMRVRQAADSSAGIWLFQTAPAADRAFAKLSLPRFPSSAEAALRAALPPL